MFTHIMVGTNDPARAFEFYDAVLGAIGVEGHHMGERAFYRGASGAFGVGKPANGEPATVGNGGTIGFLAGNKEQVEAAYAAGLANGGTSEGEPGKRDGAPGDNWGAYLRDPDGNKICVYCFL